MTLRIVVWMLCVTCFLGAANSRAEIIHACVANLGGATRIVPGATNCTVFEHSVTWNSSGPAGPAGPPGPAGAPGTPGGTLFNVVDSRGVVVGPLLDSAPFLDSGSLDGFSFVAFRYQGVTHITPVSRTSLGLGDYGTSYESSDCTGIGYKQPIFGSPLHVDATNVLYLTDGDIRTITARSFKYTPNDICRGPIDDVMDVAPLTFVGDSSLLFTPPYHMKPLLIPRLSRDPSPTRRSSKTVAKPMTVASMGSAPEVPPHAGGIIMRSFSSLKVGRGFLLAIGLYGV